MGYSKMTTKEIFRTWCLIKELRGMKEGKTVLARLAAQIAKTQTYSFFLEKPFTTKNVFEEEIIRIDKIKPESWKEWFKKFLYKRMLKNAIKYAKEFDNSSRGYFFKFF
ncbi:MAG: hypothetical protein ACPL06_01525 [Candidatus Anstonellales archaeon]